MPSGLALPGLPAGQGAKQGQAAGVPQLFAGVDFALHEELHGARAADQHDAYQQADKAKLEHGGGDAGGLEHRLFRAFPLFGGIFKVAVQPGAALLQLVDLGYGLCTFIEAEPAWRAGQAERNYARRGSLRVATKYPRIASAWYAERGVNADIVSLHGNIELGPIVGMTDRIVDVTATGVTLRDNDLVITGRIMDCTARFFVNPGAARLDPRVRNLADRLAAAVKDKHFEPVAGSAQ